MITTRRLQLNASHGDGTGEEQLLLEDIGDGKLELSVRKNAPFGEITDLATFIINKADARLLATFIQSYLFEL